jgi:lipoyl-dependent peroxiredoxin
MGEPIYTATATSSGDGRNGWVRTAEGYIDQGVRIPSSFGGQGGATNPEELFAAAYAVCFHNALRLVAKGKHVEIGDDSAVDVAIGIGPEETSFALEATITAHLPGVDTVQAEELLAAAHQICPYSRATRGNIPADLRTG